MPRRIIYALLTLSALLLPGVGRLCAQFHPVHASVVWASPRTPYLPDLYSGSRDRLVVTLTNRDATQPVLHVRMRVRIRCGTSELRSREELPYPHIVLSTGIPHRITNTDLAAYLQPDRLTNAHILRNGQLPDGFTEISVQAVDLFTGKALSDWHTARSHLSVNKPPFLIAPEKDATVALTEPTAILFRWQPRLATATEYEFTLKELPSTGESPQGAFPYGHVVHRETVRGTMLSYTHLHPPLIANRLYAWQIRAIQRDGIDEVSTYENGGYSEVSWFRLTDGCAAPTHLHAHPRYAKVELRWRDAPKAASYTIQIRPKTRLGIYEWQAFSNVSSPNTIRGLLPGRTYEWRVGASCTDIEPVYSEVEEFTLSTENEELLRDCGKVPEIPKGVSQEPHLAIKVGDVVTVGGDYPLTITEIEPLGDGWYAGRGRTQLRAIMYIPLAMRFDSLRINVDYRQIGGAVEAMSRNYGTDGLESPEISPSLGLRIFNLDFLLPALPQFTLNAQTAELITFDEAGNRHVIELGDLQNTPISQVFPLEVSDSRGNTFAINTVDSSMVKSINFAAENPILLQAESASYMLSESQRNRADSIRHTLYLQIKNKQYKPLLEIIDSRYIDGAYKHVEYIATSDNFFFKAPPAFTSQDSIGGGVLRDKLNVYISPNISDDDIKITMFHEYLHYVNYMEKILPYRYYDENKKTIWVIRESINEGRPNKEEAYKEYLKDYNNAGDLPSDINQLTQEQLAQFEYVYNNGEFDRYILKLLYKPSNACADEVHVHSICLVEEPSLYIFSPKKRDFYKKEIENYRQLVELFKKYEKENNFRPDGYEL